MRIGVLGGSFDPPHAAHAALAEAARLQLRLDRVIWTPTLTPPHKGLPSASFEHRAAMARALAASDPAAEVSEIEASLPRPSYTLQTLRALKQGNPHGHDGSAWHLILGADNWAIFPQWHRPEAVLAEASLAIYPRDGIPLRDLPPGATVLNFPEMPEQSTEYRRWLRDDREAALKALPAPVAAYIRAHGLYGTSARGTA